MFEIDGHSLPAGLALRQAPEVSPGKRKQARGEVEPLQIGLASSVEDAVALTHA